MNKENFEKIVKIAERAESMGMLAFDRISLIMDLEYVNEQFNLRLDDFFNASKLDFAHDIYGIQNNFNRQTLKMENCFVPRFTGKD